MGYHHQNAYCGVLFIASVSNTSTGSKNRQLTMANMYTISPEAREKYLLYTTFTARISKRKRRRLSYSWAAKLHIHVISYLHTVDCVTRGALGGVDNVASGSGHMVDGRPSRVGDVVDSVSRHARSAAVRVPNNAKHLGGIQHTRCCSRSLSGYYITTYRPCSTK